MSTPTSASGMGGLSYAVVWGRATARPQLGAYAPTIVMIR